jgi:glycosyltransferase involved in cell wall biosynthesis
MIKTLQVTGNSAYGGAGYLILRWCRYLLSKGRGVDILATDAYWVSILKTVPGLRVIEDIYIPRDIALLKDMQAFIKLLRLIRQEDYDVVHTYTATPGFLGRLAARMVGTPVILHHQAGWTVTEFSPLKERIFYTPLEYLASLVSSKAICVSHAVEEQARWLHIAPSRKLIVICNGIEPEPFINATQDNNRTILRHRWGFSDDLILIGSTGRLSPQKDNGSLVEAMVHLRTLLPDALFLLLVAGDGPEREKLEKMVENFKLGGQVQLLGFVKDIPAFLAMLDVFVSPSLWEGMSISILEAMAAARPIVATSILPNAELIEHDRTGLLVDPRAPKQIAQAIARFILEPQLAKECGEAAQRCTLNHYTIERMFQETWDLHQALLYQQNKIAYSSRRNVSKSTKRDVL